MTSTKLLYVHDLNRDDRIRRFEFYNIISNRIAEYRNLLWNICFSDMNDIVNKHHIRFWSDDSPAQYSEKLKVW